MKRIRKGTILSAILTGFSLMLLVLAFYAGSLFFGGAAVVLFVLGQLARKRETYDDYRARYEEKYGMAEPEEDEPKG